MAIYINDSFNAAAKVQFADPGVPSYLGTPGGFTDTGLVDVGPGITRLTLSEPVDPTARTVTASPKGTVAALLTTIDVDDSTIEVRAFDAAGAALDNVAFDIQVMRHNL